MKLLFQFLSFFLFISVLTFAQEMNRDLSQTPASFNNPEYIYGPTLEGQLGILTESFEDPTFPPAGWTKANPDGGTGWERQLAGTSPIPGWNGGTITTPTGGGSAVAFCTWNTGGATSNNQWLISPQIMNVQAGDMLSFWMQIPGYTNGYLEQVDIRISTTGTNVADFTTVVAALVFPVGSPDTNWTQYTYELTNHVPAGSNIYIGWREHVIDNLADGAAVLLDLVEVTSGGGTAFFDDFEAYVAGQQLACQNPIDWTTWSNAPCGSEDAFISSLHAYSGTKSAVIAPNNDLVKLFGSKTTGIWYISFWVYIPAGKSGYFNTMNGFTPNPFQWGMEVYFDLGGAGRLVNAATTAFTWTPDTWQLVQVVVDLALDQAQFWFNGSMVNSWQWTRGNPGSYALRLDANDFFGATANDEMYFDDYRFSDTPIPVELTSFTAIDNNGAVELNWTTATETNNQMFEIQRQSSGSEFTTIGFVSGHGTTTETQQYNYVDRTVSTGIYSYRLKQIDFDGSYEYSDVVEVDVQAPLEFALDQNYPNPFNPSTSIKYSVPETGNVRLAVFNLIGEEVAVLVNGTVQAGQYEVSFNASSLPSGVYLYKLQSANSVEVKKMMLLK